MIAGVCTAFARIRLVWALSILLAGTGLLAYVICWIVIPKE